VAFRNHLGVLVLHGPGFGVGGVVFDLFLCVVLAWGFGFCVSWLYVLV